MGEINGKLHFKILSVRNVSYVTWYEPLTYEYIAFKMSNYVYQDRIKRIKRLATEWEQILNNMYN